MPLASQNKLALNGGAKVRTTNFPAYRTIGEEEKRAVMSVLDSGILSQYIGAWHEGFWGGPTVRAFEAEWAAFFGVKHAIAVNSATSGLFAAAGAIGLEPGDEVIVSPYTMSASAATPLVYGALPVFADVEADGFCLSAESIEAQITERTRAIVIVDIFGLPYDADAINAIAKRHDLWVIEDCAQAPGARYQDRYAGTLGDIRVFSLNYHKHIHTGEGGVVVTDNDQLAENVRMIRNHAEAVMGGRDYPTLTNMLGFNYRMTEVEAAIGREQLKKLPDLLAKRREHVQFLSDRLSDIPCLSPARERPGTEHAYYVHPLLFDAEVAGMHRDRFIEGVKAELMPTETREREGVKIGGGYVRPLYLLPMFQQRQAFGSKGYPWSTHDPDQRIPYAKGTCPVAEDLHENRLIVHELIHPEMTRRDLEDVVSAFHKVWENRGELA